MNWSKLLKSTERIICIFGVIWCFHWRNLPWLPLRSIPSTQLGMISRSSVIYPRSRKIHVTDWLASFSEPSNDTMELSDGRSNTCLDPDDFAVLFCTTLFHWRDGFDRRFKRMMNRSIQKSQWLFLRNHWMDSTSYPFTATMVPVRLACFHIRNCKWNSSVYDLSLQKNEEKSSVHYSGKSFARTSLFMESKIV